MFGIPFAWLALRSAYQHSEHVATLLTLANLDAFALATWDAAVYTADEVTVNLSRAWYGVPS